MYQKIVPHLMFNSEAREAAEFYTNLFPDSGIISTRTLKGDSGPVEHVVFELMGYRFTSASTGTAFVRNPTISFLVPYLKEQSEMIDEIWSHLIDGGHAVMDIGRYPFNEKYGWLEDKYKVSWQFYLATKDQLCPYNIVPVIMFVDESAGQAEEAMKYYSHIFNDTKYRGVYHYPKGLGPGHTDYLMHGELQLEGQCFAFMDSLQAHGYKFNESISLAVNCESQVEIDQYWQQLSADPLSEMSGALKDKYGMSWLVVPSVMEEMMRGPDEALDSLTSQWLKMKKLNLSALVKAYKDV